jgi:hypothetical protein
LNSSNPASIDCSTKCLEKNPHPNNIDPAIIEHMTRTILHLDLDAIFCAVEGSTTRRLRSLAPQQPKLRPAI